MAENQGSSNAPVVAIVALVVIIIVLLFLFHPWDDGPRIIEHEKSETILSPDNPGNAPSKSELNLNFGGSGGSDNDRGSRHENRSK